MSGAVPELRFPEFKDNWKETTIGSCGTFYYGRSAPKWSVSEDAPTPCIRYGELYTKFGAKVDKIYSRTNIDPSKLKFSKGGEILVPRVGEDPRDFAKCTMLPFPGIAIGEMISVFETEEDSLFFTYYFNTMKNEFASMVAGGNPANLYYDNLKPLKIWRPSIEEQKKISSSLELVDAKLAALRQKGDGLRQFKAGLMQRLFSQELRFTREDGSDYPEWEEKPFSEIATRAGEQFDPRKENGKPRVIELEHLESGSGKILSSADIDGQISLKNRFRSGDVLFGKLRPYLRKFARPDFDGVCSSEIWVLRGRKGVSNSFLFALVQSPMFTQVVNISSGSKMPRADWKTIAGADFPVPCPEEQEKVAAALSAVDAKIDAVTDQITHMETFKKGLLQKMFV